MGGGGGSRPSLTRVMGDRLGRVVVLHGGGREVLPLVVGQTAMQELTLQ